MIVRASVAGAAVLTSLGLASPAQAHTEIEVDDPQAGAANVTMAVTVEAESDSAGIASVRVVLPDGIAPGQASLVSGPDGWSFTAGTDGYTMSGAALPKGTDAKFSVRIAQLPATASVLIFKTLATYSDGTIVRWIEETTAANPKPDKPAPTVSLRPAATPTAAPSTPAAAVSPTPAPPATQAAAPAANNTETTWWPWALAAVVLLAIGVAGTVMARRRLGTQRTSSSDS